MAADADTVRYCVVTLVGPDDPYAEAGKRLAALRDARQLSVDRSRLGHLRIQLQELQPEYVAFVARPEQIDLNLVHVLLQLSTQLDEDPFVDFSYGMITGRTPAAAIRLAEAARQAERRPRTPQFAVAGVAGGDYLKRSRTRQFPLQLKGMDLRAQWHEVIEPSVNGGQRDTQFISEMLENLEGQSMIALAGHGFPDRIVGGPNWSDLAGRDYTGAVAFNIACYTGVTSHWFENNWQTGHIDRHCVSNDESFGLRMLDTGVAAYVAYACPRPAGTQMFADMIELATQGISVGEQRRRQANSVILTHLGQGFAGLVAESVAAGDPLKPGRSPEELVRSMSAGSVLYGDPAFQPFEQVPGAYSLQLVTRREGRTLNADVRGTGMWMWHCSDSLEQTKLKVETTLPLGDDGASSIAMDRYPFGDANRPLRLHAALERHAGQNFLHVKALFERPGQATMMSLWNGFQASFRVELAAPGDRGHQVLMVAQDRD